MKKGQCQNIFFLFIVGLSHTINPPNYDSEKDEEDGPEKEISEGIKIFFKSCFLDMFSKKTEYWCRMLQRQFVSLTIPVYKNQEPIQVQIDENNRSGPTTFL